VDSMPAGGQGPQIVARPSTLVGGRIQNGLPQPTDQTDYAVYGANGPRGTLSVAGPDRRVGGGTLSAPDQGNGGMVDGNVAAYNRQIAALRDLREARNPGITAGLAERAFGGLVSFGTPGGGYGQEQLDANRTVSPYDRQMGLPRERIARRDLISLMEMQQRGQQFAAQQDAEQNRLAMQQQQAGILSGADAARDAANRQWEQAKFNQQYGLDERRFGLDQQSRQVGMLRELAGLNREQTTQALFDRYLNAQDETQQRAALDALKVYQGSLPQDKVVPFNQQVGVDVLGKPIYARSLYDVNRREVINTGGEVAGQGARPAIDTDKAAKYRALRAAGKSEQEALAAIGG